MSLLKSSAVISCMTMASRLLGFLRDVLMANLLGASWLSDAFFVAFKLPNFFRRLFAEGAFNAAFVPQYTKLLEADGANAARDFASHVFGWLLLALLALNAIFLTFMPWLLQWFAPGFADNPEKYALTVELAQICFPYILCISLVSLLGGVLNAHGRFAAVAAAPIGLNLCLIVAMVCFSGSGKTPAHALSWGVCAAGLLQLVWLMAAAARTGSMPRVRIVRFTRPVRRFFALLAPAALGAGVAQVNLLIDVVLASLFAEGVSYLYYADRLNQLPIGVIGVAVGTALLPMLSRHYKRADLKGAEACLNRGIELVWLFALPAMIAFWVLPELMIRTLYQHGAFDSADTQATYHALMAYALGLPAFLLIKVLAPGFFANDDTKTPFKIGLVCVSFNLVLNLILMQYLAHVGLALATSLAGWLNAGLMAWVLHRRGLLRLDADARRRLPRFAIAAGLMGLVLWAAAPLIALSDSAALGILIGLGGAVFLTSIMASGALRPSELRVYLRQK